MRSFAIKLLSIALAAIALLLLRFAIADSVVSDPSGPRSISEEYFGLHIHRGATTLHWPRVRFHSWRIIKPETTWYSMERRRGIWNFGALDKAVAVANARGVEVMYTLGYAPQWAIDPKFINIWNPGLALPPQDLRDWETYVQVVVNRYKGRIKYYELMNEPNFTEVDAPYSKRDFSVFTMVKMAEIASRIINENDPEARLVSMSPSGAYNGIRRVDAFLKAGGGKYIDVVGFHFYEKTPEGIPKLTRALQKALSDNGQAHLPIWNTESGFYIDAPNLPAGKIPPGEVVYTPTQGGALVSRSLILSAAAGISRFYWFAWDGMAMALTEGDGKKITPAGDAYIKTERWLRGATITECRSPDKKQWICALARGGARAWLVWDTEETRDWKVPASWEATHYEPLYGGSTDIDANGFVRIGTAPLLIKSTPTQWGAL